MPTRTAIMPPKSTAHKSGTLPDGTLCFLIDNIRQGKPKKKGDDIPTKINLLNIGDSLLLLPCGWGTDEFKGKPTEIKCQTDCNEKFYVNKICRRWPAGAATLVNHES